MALYFDEETKKHLFILINASTKVLVDFCKLALDYIKNGANIKKYEIAAQKLETTPQDIENGVTVLVKVILDGCKHSLSTEDFAETMTLAGFSREATTVLSKLYSSRGPELGGALSRLSSHSALPSYSDLSWRLQAQVASRSVPEQVAPRALLVLTLGQGPSARARPLQSTLPRLVRLTGALQAALRDSRTFHVRRTQRLLDQ